MGKTYCGVDFIPIRDERLKPGPKHGARRSTTNRNLNIYTD